jgi:hypothetical protein
MGVGQRPVANSEANDNAFIACEVQRSRRHDGVAIVAGRQQDTRLNLSKLNPDSCYRRGQIESDQKALVLMLPDENQDTNFGPNGMECALDKRWTRLRSAMSVR